MKVLGYMIALVMCSVLVIDVCAIRGAKPQKYLTYTEKAVTVVKDEPVIKDESQSDRVWWAKVNPVRSGMLCELYEGVDEQETEEETTVVSETEPERVLEACEPLGAEDGRVEEINTEYILANETVESTWVEPVQQTETEPIPEVTATETEVQTEAQTEPQTEPPKAGIPIYAVNGDVLDPNVQVFLYNELAKYHIEYFMPYSIMIAYQESHFNYSAVNPVNGIDMGLFQFRVTYYPGANIFDPYEQIVIFCQMMGNRAASGCDVYTMISRHNTSDYCGYNQQYVNEVLQHQGVLVQIKTY